MLDDQIPTIDVLYRENFLSIVKNSIKLTITFHADIFFHLNYVKTVRENS